MVLMLTAVALAAAALHLWSSHRLTGHAQLLTLEAVADLGAAELSETISGEETNDREPNKLDQRFEQWAWAVLHHPQMVAAALLDERGRLSRCIPPDVAVEPALASIPAAGRFSGPCQAGILGDRTRTWAVSVPLSESAGAGSVVIFARGESFTAASPTWALCFALPLLGVTLIGSVIALRWLRRQLGEPLRSLIRQSNEDDHEWRARLPIEREDEIGLIAREVHQVMGDLAEAQVLLDRLRRGLHLRVAERTREINRMLKDTQRKVWIDPLTHLGNRRLLDERIEELFVAQQASGGALSVVMFDLDNFKIHNDTHGHAAGDDLLRFFGQLLRGSLRETDIGIRFAGDEFVVLAPDVAPEEAVALATRIVRLFGQHTSLFDTEPRPTLSAGVASIPRSGAATGLALLQQADAALYEAKARGKDTVCLAAEMMPDAPKPVGQPTGA